MDQNPRIYEGNKKYIFVSYSHADKKAVFSILKDLEQHGYRFWYDKGISAGSEWTDEIAEHLKNAYVVMFVQTANSASSGYCKDEISYAYQLNKNLLTVVLEKVILPAGLEMQLVSRQSVIFSDYKTFDSFISAIMTCKDLSLCKGSEKQLSESEKKSYPLKKELPFDKNSIRSAGKRAGSRLLDLFPITLRSSSTKLKDKLIAEWNFHLDYKEKERGIVLNEIVEAILTLESDPDPEVAIKNDYELLEVISWLYRAKRDTYLRLTKSRKSSEEIARAPRALARNYKEANDRADSCKRQIEIYQEYLPEKMW